MPTSRRRRSSLVATSGPGGLDCSPRGDPPGFVRVVDERTLLMPDRRGNNRLDTLRNLVVDPRDRLAVPGAWRSASRCASTAPPSSRPTSSCAQSFAMDGKLPTTVIVVTTTSVYTQCPKALIRSHLWDPTRHRDPSELPSVGDDHGSDHRRGVRWQGIRRRLSRAGPPDDLLM